MINDGSKLGEIVQENTYSIVENYWDFKLKVLFAQRLICNLSVFY
jgi:hypothetical protein